MKRPISCEISSRINRYLAYGCRARLILLHLKLQFCTLSWITWQCWKYQQTPANSAKYVDAFKPLTILPSKESSLITDCTLKNYWLDYMPPQKSDSSETFSHLSRNNIKMRLSEAMKVSMKAYLLMIKRTKSDWLSTMQFTISKNIDDRK